MDVAIIGMAGRFPEAENVSEFYKNLSEGKDSVRTISEERLKATTMPSDHQYFPSGYLDNIDQFDNDFFNISLGEAEHMDPHQRMMMEVVYETLENAGKDVDEYAGSNTAVFVGDTNLEYFKLAEAFDPTLITGNMNAAIAGRIARYFNLRGSALMIDTTCSSSLVALHYAVKELISGDADQALVCGARITLFPIRRTKEFDEVGIISPQGKAKAFSDGANGTGGGEAIVGVLLKRLDDAIRDKDVIHAVIKGSAVNQDAQLSGSLTAPSSQAQMEVIIQAWNKAQIDPRKITYIEAHGTGTKLGDPIEVEGISRAFRAFTDKYGFCAISAVKTNIGHTGSAAGLVGLVKAVLSLKYKKLFPSVNFDKPNPYIDFEHSAVYVNTKLKEWVAEKRYAGVSSFGLSGTNCHVVLEEFQSSSPTPAGTSEPGIITLSAHHPESLQAFICALREYLSDEIALKDLCYTLGAGRKHYAHRIAFVATDISDVITQLSSPVISTAEQYKLVLVMSDHFNMPPDEVAKLRETSPEFNWHYKNCLQHIPTLPDTHPCRKFIFLYACYKMLEEKGIHVDNVIGYGIGELVLSVLTFRHTLSDVPELLATYREPSIEELEMRCKRLSENTVAGTIYAEIGFGGLFSDFMKACQGTSVITMHSGNTCINFIKSLYLSGHPVNWQAFYRSSDARSIVLPGYRFKRRRCWIREQPEYSVENHMYEMQWVSEKSKSKPDVLKNETFLVFGNNEEDTQRLVRFMQTQHAHCIAVHTGTQFFAGEAGDFTIDPYYEDQYLLLAKQMDTLTISGIILLYNGEMKSPAAPVPLPVFMQYCIGKAFHRQLSIKGFRYIFLTNTETPEAAMGVSFVKALLSEQPGLKVSAITVDSMTDAPETVWKEMAGDDTLRFVRYIKGERQVPALKPVHPVAASGVLLPGTYIISGGAGGIGMAISKHLAETGPCRLILLGQLALPERAAWTSLVQKADTDAITQRIEDILHLERLGATVNYHSVDISDATAMHTLFNGPLQDCTRIDGVIHAAGIPVDGVLLPDKPLPAFAKTLCPKVGGTLLLEQLTKRMQPTFFLMFSSLNAVVPQRGSIDYTVANGYMDALAHNRPDSPTRYISVNWPAWSEVGMSHRKRNGQSDGGRSALRSISPQEGIRAISHILASNVPQVMIIDMDFSLFSANPFFLTVMPTAEEATAAAISTHPLISDNATDTEETIAAIWQEVLKFETIGPDDDFFDRGGHSLNGAQVLNRVKKAYGIDIDFDVLLEHGTIRNFSAYVDELLEEGIAGVQKDIPALNKQPFYEMSHAQQRIWVLSNFKDAQVAYNMPGAFIIKGSLHLESFRKVFGLLLQRHEILRTAFVEVDGKPMQMVMDLKDMDWQMEWADISSDPDAEEKLQELVRKEFHKPFNLSGGSLIRTKLVKLEEEKFVFLLTLHHIISDHWSRGILLKEISLLYNALKKGQPAQLPSLRLQYRDYAAWQNNLIAEPGFSGHRAYWMDQFCGTIPQLNFPTDLPRPMIKTYRGKSLFRPIGKDLLEKARTFTRHHNVSLFMLLISVVKTLLYRYTGDEDIIIGSPIASRENSDLEDQLGLYQNILPIRSRISPGESFEVLLGRIRSVVLKAYEYQAYPFDKLVDDLALSRDMSRSPLFDVMVLLQNMQKETGTPMDGLEIGQYTADLHTSKYDLTFDFYESEAAIFMRLEYNTDLFREEKIQQLLAHFNSLLDAILENSKTPVGDLVFMSPQETKYLVESLNDTATPYPHKSALHTLFRRQVELHPAAVAIIHDDICITYAGLDELSDQVAACLQEQYMIGGGEVVALIMQRSEKMLIALMGILKAGAAYLPIDPDYPQERISYLLQDASPAVLVTDGEYAGYGISIPILDVSDLSLISLFSQPTVAEDPAGPAYVIYTSGSTGMPKGVMVDHQGAVNRIDWMWKQYAFSTADVILQKTANVFDVSVWELFMPLCFGAKLVCCPKSDAGDPLKLAVLTARHKITTAHFVASMLNTFLDAADHYLLPSLRSLRHVITSGEALMQETVKHFYRKLPIPLHNLYGPTEASVDVSYYQTSLGDRTAPIGKPISNIRLYILDTSLQPVPLGVSGEICIAGIGLARGYLNRPLMTAERFVIIKIGDREERIYRTGDLGRWREDGCIEFHGRNDRQVKVRGFRVEPAEIESILLQMEQVSNAVVLVENDTLMAYCVTDEPTANVRAYLSERLPEYMVPSVIMPLTSLPFTVNGKVDRKALLMAAQDLPQADNSAPTGYLEQELMNIWTDVLPGRRFGIHDNFFEQGGHSLTAMKVLTRIYQVLHVRPELADIFRYPTVATMATHIRQLAPALQEEIKRLPDQKYYELSHSQKQLWIQEQLADKQFTFNIHQAYTITGCLDVPALEKAFRALISRHEVLRSVFVQADGFPMQQVLENVSFSIRKEDWRHRRNVDLASISQVSKYKAFDLSSAPLLHVELYHLEEEQYALLLTIHHLISDGWSMAILFRDLASFYNQFSSRSEVSPLPQLPFQFRDYANWHNNILKTSHGESLKAYWHNKLGSDKRAAVTFPADNTLIRNESNDGSVASILITGEDLARLNIVAVQREVTMFMMMIAVIKVLLYKYTAAPEISIGTPSAGRVRRELEDQMGYYLNTLILKDELSPEQSFAVLLEQVKQTALDAFAHQLYPIEKLVDELGGKRTAEQTSLFRVGVSWQNFETGVMQDYGGSDDFRGLSLKVLETKVRSVANDIWFFGFEIADGLLISVFYKTGLYHPSRIEKMGRELKEIAHFVCGQPSCTIADILTYVQSEDTVPETSVSGARSRITEDF